MKNMDSICDNCSFRLGDHFCDHTLSIDCIDSAVIRQHSCPISNSNGTFKPADPFGSAGWFSPSEITKIDNPKPNKDSTKESWRMWAHNIPGECACGIPTHMCTYHK